MNKTFNLVVIITSLLLTLISIALPKKYKQISLGLILIALTILVAGIIVEVLI